MSDRPLFEQRIHHIIAQDVGRSAAQTFEAHARAKAKAQGESWKEYALRLEAHQEMTVGKTRAAKKSKAKPDKDAHDPQKEEQEYARWGVFQEEASAKFYAPAEKAAKAWVAEQKQQSIERKRAMKMEIDDPPEDSPTAEPAEVPVVIPCATETTLRRCGHPVQHHGRPGDRRQGQLVGSVRPRHGPHRFQGRLALSHACPPWRRGARSGPRPAIGPKPVRPGEGR